MNRFFRIYIVPSAVFQSVMVGGGYGTGREIVEYFTAYGAAGGLLAIFTAFLVLSLVLSVTFEFSRCFRVYDYRRFFQSLIGSGWIAFEALIILMFVLILAVLASASGNILHDYFNTPYVVGLLVMLGVIGTLAFYGEKLIKWVLTFWSFFLYAVVLAFFVAVFSQDSAPMADLFQEAEIRSGWLWSGIKYAMYNVAVVPLLLYVAREFETRGEAVRSGIVAGAVAMAPALAFQLAFLTAWPEVLDQAIPVYWMIGSMGMSTLALVYSVMLFGTFIETGAGMLQGINDRVDSYLVDTHGTSLRPIARAVIAMSAILVSAGLSLMGITALIARGYGTMALGFMLVYVVPLLTIGVYRMRKQQQSNRD